MMFYSVRHMHLLIGVNNAAILKKKNRRKRVFSIALQCIGIEHMQSSTTTLSS